MTKVFVWCRRLVQRRKNRQIAAAIAVYLYGLPVKQRTATLQQLRDRDPWWYGMVTQAMRKQQIEETKRLACEILCEHINAVYAIKPAIDVDCGITIQPTPLGRVAGHIPLGERHAVVGGLNTQMHACLAAKARIDIFELIRKR